MKQNLQSTLCAFIILSVCSMPVFSRTERMFDSFGAAECEDEMARLDNFALELMNSPDARAYIVVYGGKRGTYRDEVQVRGARMKRYMIETRGLSPDRIKVIKGGFRELFTVELWVVPNDKSAPTATPTVDATAVRYKKGKMARFREPGCFPGKYLNEKFQHKQGPVSK